MIQRSKLGGTSFDFYPLEHLADAGIENLSYLPMTVKILLEGLVRLVEAGVTEESNIGVLAHWPALPPADAELPFLPARRDAIRDEACRQRRGEGRPAGPGRPDHRPLGAGRLIRFPRLVHEKHREGDPAQPGALLAPSLGAAGVPQLFSRAPGHGDLPPGEPGVPRQGRAGPRHRWTQGRDPGHSHGHRLAHHDGQRPGGAGLGHRWNRGRGRDPRAARLPGVANRRRRAVRRGAASRIDRHRPRADAHRDAPQARCCRQVRRVLR